MFARTAVLLGLLAAPVAAATPAAYAALDRDTVKVCKRVSELNNARVGSPVRFSDTMLIDARVVTGTWRPAHMKGRRATMLCIYNRRTKQAEVQELALPAR